MNTSTPEEISPEARRAAHETREAADRAAARERKAVRQAAHLAKVAVEQAAKAAKIAAAAPPIPAPKLQRRIVESAPRVVEVLFRRAFR